MTIYHDSISEALGLRPIQELVPDYTEDDFIPNDALSVYKGHLNPFFGKKHTEEIRLIIKEARRNQIMLPHMEETKRKISNSLIGHLVSEETKKKISEKSKGKSKSNKGQPKRKIDCPHCGKIGAIAMMHRWHFENCKEKK